MKKNKGSYLLFLMSAVGLLFWLSSCSKMDSSYYLFIKHGERVYTGKADSLQAISGKNRAKLSWVLLSDPSITGCRITWTDPDGSEDSSDVSVNKTPGVVHVQTVITNLPEGHYDFYVSSYDDQDHSSVKSAIGVYVYGDIYRSDLSNRIPRSFIAKGDSLVSDWYVPDTVNVNTEVKYTDIQGRVKIAYLSPDSSSLVIPDWQAGTQIYYTSSYKPLANSLDTFTVSRPDSMAQVDITNGGTTFSVQRENVQTEEVSPNLVDDNINTKFLLFNFKGVWAQLEFKTPEVVNAYMLTSANDSPERDPDQWELLGSNDGIDWQVLDSKSGQTFSNRLQSVQYNFNNTVPYKYYRLNIISVAGGNGGLFQMAEWRLLRRF